MFWSPPARVWNEAAAHRLSTLGMAARRGDLVWQQEEDGAAAATSPQVMEEEEEEIKHTQWLSILGDPLLSPHRSSLPNHALATHFWELRNDRVVPS